MKSLKDVYRKFLHTRAAEHYLSKSVCQPFFYVRNNNFCGVFMRDAEGRPMCVMNPNKTMAAQINSQGIQKII